MTTSDGSLGTLAIDCERVLVLSPHLDDAVLSCGHLVAGATQALVVTMFAGKPTPYPRPLSQWDADCGFSATDDIVAIRRAEDEAAVEVLGAVGRRFDLLDGQYRGRHNYKVGDLADLIREVIADWRPTTIAIPLGLGHRDHMAVCSAGLSLHAEASDRAWLGYVEFPYAWDLPGAAARRIAHVRRSGYVLTPALTSPDAPDLKARAMKCYASQLGGLRVDGGVELVAALPEQLWIIANRRSIGRRAAGRAAYELEKRGLDLSRSRRRGKGGRT